MLRRRLSPRHLFVPCSGNRDSRFPHRQAHIIDRARSHPPVSDATERSLVDSMMLPCFCPVLPEDSLFLPRCGHAAGSHFASGGGKWGDCQMMVKASGRSALITATGLFLCFAGPSPVVAASSDSAATASKSESATPGKSAKQSVRHWKRYARKSGKVASKSADSKKSAEKDVADASGNT